MTTDTIESLYRDWCAVQAEIDAHTERLKRLNLPFSPDPWKHKHLMETSKRYANARARARELEALADKMFDRKIAVVDRMFELPAESIADALLKLRVADEEIGIADYDNTGMVNAVIADLERLAA